MQTPAKASQPYCYKHHGHRGPEKCPPNSTMHSLGCIQPSLFTLDGCVMLLLRYVTKKPFFLISFFLSRFFSSFTSSYLWKHHIEFIEALSALDATNLVLVYESGGSVSCLGGCPSSSSSTLEDRCPVEIRGFKSCDNPPQYRILLSYRCCALFADSESPMSGEEAIRKVISAMVHQLEKKLVRVNCGRLRALFGDWMYLSGKGPAAEAVEAAGNGARQETQDGEGYTESFTKDKKEIG